MMRSLRPFLIIVALLAGKAAAQNETPLTRDEVAGIKKKLVNVLDALGQPPSGYATDRESFNLPTEVYKVKDGGLFQPVNASVDCMYGSEKKTEKSGSDFKKEYEKKIADAQAKGDVQAMANLAQELQKKAGELQLKAIGERKDPISVSVHTNSNSDATIDPDAVAFERPGLIALKSKVEDSDEKVRVTIYFDPVSLKETKQLSKVDLKMPEKGTNSKTTLFNVTIEMQGPTTEVETWAKKIDSNKVLAQIDKGK